MDPELHTKSITKLTMEILADALSIMLKAHASQFFGALKAVEHKIVALRAMQGLCATLSQPI